MQIQVAHGLSRLWKKKKRPASAGSTPQRRTPSHISRSHLVLGAAAITLSCLSSLMLAIAHFVGMSLPGCGPQSDCAQAAASAWGTVPLLGWPVSFLGLAFFTAIGAAWSVQSGMLHPLVRLLVRFGAAASIFFIAVMIFGGYLCIYCLIAHLGNLAFWIAVERAPRPARPHLRGIAAFAAIFTTTSLVLVVTNWKLGAAVTADRERALAESTSRIIAATTQPTSTAADRIDEPSDPEAAPAGFTGRYRLGPEEAAVRIVAFTDYECPICRELDKQIASILRRHKDVSFSIKHYPACEDCNESYKQRTIHPNACRAARAAEAAGALWGEEAFWEMHDWLFLRRGHFDFSQILDYIEKRGRDSAKFLDALNGDQSLARVKSDITEALDLGVSFTPTVFINGVELEGARADNAIERAVDAVLEKNPPPRTAEFDRPRAAAVRYVELWRNQPVKELAEDKAAHQLGPSAAAVQIVLWGDFQDSYTAEADIAIRKIVSTRSDASYSFRQFPLNKACNWKSVETLNVLACDSAKAAEAAGLVGGHDTYWKMHDWLMRNPSQVFELGLKSTAKEIGIDPESLWTARDKPEVMQAIAADVEAGAQSGLTRIPWIFVNGKLLARISGNRDDVLSSIIAAAAE